MTDMKVAEQFIEVQGGSISAEHFSEGRLKMRVTILSG
jgi:hypothetical protein